MKTFEEKQLQINNRNYNSNVRLSTVLQDPYTYSQFDLSSSHKTSFNSGQAVPIWYKDLLPGDIIRIKLDSLIKMSAPASNTMVNPVISINFFYITFSQLWKPWIHFFGDNKNAGYTPTITSLPKFKLGSNVTSFVFDKNDWASKFYPVQVDFVRKNDKIVMNHILLGMAYCKFVNDWFRDQNLDSEVVYNDNLTTDLVLEQNFAESDDYHTKLIYGKGYFPVSKLPDYFTTALPWRQKGDSLVINNLPLNNLSITGNIGNDPQSPQFKPTLYNGDGTVNNNSFSRYLTMYNGHLQTKGDSGSLAYFDEPTLRLGIQNGKINYIGDTTDFYTINDLRNSITLQHYLELDARFGTRYNEYLYAHWGILVDPLDVGKSVYIGGYEDSLKITSVLQTSETSNNSPLGSVGGVLQNYFEVPEVIEFAAKDHGIIMAIVCVRTPIYYANTIDRFLLAENKYDFFDPLFANISDQPIYEEELFFDIGNGSKVYNKDVFGYNEAWASYRYSINKVTGILNPYEKTNLANLYVFSEKYSSVPKLGIDWMTYKPNIIANSLFTVNDNIEFYDQFIADFNFNVKIERQIPLFGVPGVGKI